MTMLLIQQLKQPFIETFRRHFIQKIHIQFSICNYRNKKSIYYLFDTKVSVELQCHLHLEVNTYYSVFGSFGRKNRRILGRISFIAVGFQISSLQRENGLLSYCIHTYNIVDILKTNRGILKILILPHAIFLHLTLAVYPKCPCVHRDSSQGTRSVLSGL